MACCLYAFPRKFAVQDDVVLSRPAFRLHKFFAKTFSKVAACILKFNNLKPWKFSLVSSSTLNTTETLRLIAVPSLFMFYTKKGQIFLKFLTERKYREKIGANIHLITNPLSLSSACFNTNWLIIPTKSNVFGSIILKWQGYGSTFLAIGIWLKPFTRPSNYTRK